MYLLRFTLCWAALVAVTLTRDSCPSLVLPLLELALLMSKSALRGLGEIKCQHSVTADAWHLREADTSKLLLQVENIVTQSAGTG